MIDRVVEFINMYFEIIIIVLFVLTIIISILRIWRVF
jgi:hypothetical protein